MEAVDAQGAEAEGGDPQRGDLGKDREEEGSRGQNRGSGGRVEQSVEGGVAAPKKRRALCTRQTPPPRPQILTASRLQEKLRSGGMCDLQGRVGVRAGAQPGWVVRQGERL